MRKRSVTQRVLAAFAGAAVTLTLLPVSAFAEGLSALSEGATLRGEPQTVKVAAAEMGRSNNFNDGWKFYLGDSSTAQNRNFDDSGWETVTLPHDFSISQSFTTSGEAESGFLPGGTGWYRKTFTLPESCADKTLLLNFDGVYSDATVYVNGVQVGEHHYGYTSFAFDISEYVVCDGAAENVVAVKAVNKIPSSRWYSGSGIYRDVTLLALDPVHVELNGACVTTPDIAGGAGTVQTAVEVVNDSAETVDVTVRSTIYEKNSETALATAATTVTVAAGATETAAASPVVSSPKLWSTEAPNLYTARTELLVDGVVRDTCDTTFGFRYFSFDDTGFHLNGENVKLNGVCLHHDQGALGSAAYYDAMYRQLSIMKDMGVNAVRTSHNPADEDFIEICSELGLLVVEEAFDGWSVSKNGNSEDFAKYFNTALDESNQILGGSSGMTWAEFAVKSMVRRDRNAPSVILWSLGNEIQEGASAPSTYPTIAQNLIDWIKEEDATRQTTIGSNQRTTSGVLGSVHSVVKNNGGIVGFNYASSAELESMYRAYGPIIASETSSAVNSRGIYTTQANASSADGKYHLTSYDTSKVSWGKTAHDSMWDTLTLDYVAGEFVWTGFDYIGEPTPWNGTGSGSVSGAGAIPNSSYFGIVDTAGFEKDTYWLYRSQWNQKETTLHLVTAWDSDNQLTTDGKTPVVVYSNAPVVKLYRNGVLIGTATRTVNTTAAGHTYYTYTTASENSDVCTAVSASGSASLYATFNVTYAAGTISARAFEEDGITEITLTGNSGSSSVSTPGAPSRLKVTQNKTEINADGSSLVYIAVEVQDADGHPDTTAANAIRFSLAGSGEIVGVDNGDQATTAKYQQPGVLTGAASAQIAAYAGKALVIVRSTQDAGSFTVNVSSDGLTGGSVTVTTKEVGGPADGDELVSYTLVRDYTVLTGTVPTLDTTVTGTLADGSTVSGTVEWDAVPEDVYGTAGDYTVKGTITFENGAALAASCRLHVIARVTAVRNISAVTASGAIPTLPGTVKGVMADGTLTGEFKVTWESLSADRFAAVGDIVTVNGTAAIFGEETKPVTATVRVAEAVNTESNNVATSASSLEQDIPKENQSDNLESIRNGTTKPGDNTSERWSNWGNRENSATATLTFRWDTAQMLSSVNLYYYYDTCAAKPESVAFAYSLNGTDFIQVEATEELVEEYSLGEEYTYTFAWPVNPVALQITLTQQDGTTGSHCVALTEAEIMTFAGRLEYNGSAALSDLAVDGTTVEGFAPDTLEYAAAAPAETAAVTAETEVNAGITVLPVYENVVRILTVSEDGSDERTYAVTLNSEPACLHEHTEVRNVKKAACTEEGYTGDTYCRDCGEQIASGETIPATGHAIELRNAKEATCTEEGYTGDEVCTVCGEMIQAGSAIPARGHSWNSGVVTKEPTETEEGVKTYTCTVCGETKTEVIPATGPAPAERTAPKVSFSASVDPTTGKLLLTGCFADYEHLENYYDVTAHGLVYLSTAKLGTHNLTVNTAGRTRVNFGSYKADGSFTYRFKPAYNSTRYTVRAFLAYVDPATKRTVYVYSAPMIVSYNALASAAVQ